jgi:hypothetical protein
VDNGQHFEPALDQEIVRRWLDPGTDFRQPSPFPTSDQIGYSDGSTPEEGPEERHYEIDIEGGWAEMKADRFQVGRLK